MTIVYYSIFVIAFMLVYIYFSHLISYKLLKLRIINRHKWDLNICCGHIDGGGVNVDICKHTDLRNFILIDDIYHLPFKDKQFNTVLCSHTIEHVDNPKVFYKELKRVGDKVILIVPPLWDISAVLNIFEHKWIMLTFRKEHSFLPKYIRLPLARFFHRRFKQKVAC